MLADLHAPGPRLGRHLRQQLAVAVGQRQRAALGRQLPRQFRADAAGRAGDDGDPAVDVECHLSSLMLAGSAALI
ncbi:hypothetical protein D3C83_197690 [compost metagenome]